MVLKNNTAMNRSAFLIRYVNVDAAGAFQNNLDGTADSVFGWNSFRVGNPFGLVLKSVGNSALDHARFIQNVPDGPAPCSPSVHEVTGPLTNADGSAFMFYAMTVPKGQSKTVNVSYKGL